MSTAKKAIGDVGLGYDSMVRIHGDDPQSEALVKKAFEYKAMLDELGSLEKVSQKIGLPEETISQWIGLAELVTFLRRL